MLVNTWIIVNLRFKRRVKQLNNQPSFVFYVISSFIQFSIVDTSSKASMYHFIYTIHIDWIFPFWVYFGRHEIITSLFILHSEYTIVITFQSILLLLESRGIVNLICISVLSVEFNTCQTQRFCDVFLNR